VILLDTHVWVWWVHGDSRLSASHAKLIAENEDDEIGIGTILIWEVAKLVELGRLVLPVALGEWFTDELAYPGITLIDLTPQIASNRLNCQASSIATLLIRSSLRRPESLDVPC